MKQIRDICILVQARMGSQRVPGKMSDLQIIDEIEKIRSKNNVNWMDILRLAFKYAPTEARKIMSKINNDDNKISELLNQLSNNAV